MKIALSFILNLIFISSFATSFNFTSDGYLKAVEVDKGDTFSYQLKDGSIQEFVLISTSARPVYTFSNSTNQWESGRVYTMECDLLVNGQTFHMQRFVSAQQSFYEPIHINGVTLFFDAVLAIESFIHDNHGGKSYDLNVKKSFPNKDARFAFIEYGDQLCNQRIKPWVPLKEQFISIEDSYEGGDTWLGAFKKDEAHTGLDINLPNNTKIWAPIAFDNQEYFNSIAKGDNNNRWRGFTTWENGEKWMLRSHHMTELHVEENIPIKQQEEYGEIAGTHYGSHPHAHFYFKWFKDPVGIALDPWILFWKMFENINEDQNQVKADISPLKNAVEGNAIVLDARNSRKGVNGVGLSYFWSTSEGMFYEGERVKHIVSGDGVHAVTLLVTNGVDSSWLTQHFTVLKASKPVKKWLKLSGGDKEDFRVMPIAQTSTYGLTDIPYGNYLNFFLRKNGNYQPQGKEVRISADKKTLKSIQYKIEYLDKEDWLNITLENNTLNVNIIPSKLSKALGKYQAKVTVNSKQTGLEQSFYVDVYVPDHRFKPGNKVVVDDKNIKYFPSRFYWIQNPYERAFLDGFGKFTVWSGNDEISGFARYQPDLKKGKYKVYIHPQAKAEPLHTVEKQVEMLKLNIKTTNGIVVKEWYPKKSGEVGTFEFLEGKESYIEVDAGQSKGLICLDALIFEKID